MLGLILKASINFPFYETKFPVFKLAEVYRRANRRFTLYLVRGKKKRQGEKCLGLVGVHIPFPGVQGVVNLEAVLMGRFAYPTKAGEE
jgi:hypothetical protein